MNKNRNTNKNCNVQISPLERGLRGVFCIALILLNLTFSKSFSQKIIAGPIIGAVSDSSANLLFISDAFAEGFIKISNKPVLLDDGKINPDVDASNSLVINFKGTDTSNKINLFYFDILLPDTKYYYFVSYGNDEKTGSFKTFPSSNTTSNFTFTFGSCSENYRDDSVFVEMKKHHPDLFLHLGDWTYPDNLVYPEKPTKDEHRFYVADQNEIFKSYVIRYNLPNLKKFLDVTPVDYVFDDDDGIWDDFSKHSYCDLKLENGKTKITQVPFPDSLRNNLLAAYHQYFPGYVNPSHPKEAYHSFMYGNTEVFFLDTRSTRSPNSEVFHQNKKGVWKYMAAANHEILDSAQLDWLLAGLKNSKADWKIIVSGTSFNAEYKKILDICLLKAAQNRALPNKLTGIYVAGAMSAMWFSFPATQGKLINFCHDNKIKNVFVCSGDAHTSAIDDGKHAGFPEIMSANLGQVNTELASIEKNNLRLNLWDQGGQGIGNKNFNDAFGKVEIMGKDSVRLSCIDKHGTEICNYVLKDGFIPKKYNIRRHSKITFGAKLTAVKNALKIAIHQKK